MLNPLGILGRMNFGEMEVWALEDDAFRAAEELGINISSRFESTSIDEI